MSKKEKYASIPRLWILEPLPYYSNVWLFKANHVTGRGKFVSYQQTPSGITIRIVSKGEWIVNMNGHVAKVSSGGIFCALPGENIEFSQTENKAWEWYEIQFIGSAAEDFMGEFGLGLDSPSAVPEKPEEAIKIFKDIYNYIESKERTESGMFSLLFSLISACGKSKEKNEGEKTERKKEIVAKAIDCMEANLELNVNITEIAEKLNIERTTLYRAFKDKTGKSPHQYLDWLRRNKAEELLRYTGIPVGTIALRLGFTDAKYFISWFKAQKGIPPGLWRNDVPAV
jgi:AraC-like DNA-binding protein